MRENDRERERNEVSDNFFANVIQPTEIFHLQPNMAIIIIIFSFEYIRF